MERYFELIDENWWAEYWGVGYKYAIYKEDKGGVYYYDKDGKFLSVEAVISKGAVLGAVFHKRFFKEINFDPTSKYIYSVSDIIDV